ncbi:Uncharacterised protein [Mycobacteroides abscessus subsp. abscessus]|nr:Uncharacterised protein [Mycobacteroides abscessus subsp. abscessus]
MGERAAEDFDDVAVGQCSDQWTSTVLPVAFKVAHRPCRTSEFVPGELASDRVRIVCGRHRPQLPVGEPLVHRAKAVRVVELGGQHGCDAQRELIGESVGGQTSEHGEDRKIRRRPRLVEPLLTDRPATVVGQPRQVRVQHQGELAGHGATAALWVPRSAG